MYELCWLYELIDAFFQKKQSIALINNQIIKSLTLLI